MQEKSYHTIVCNSAVHWRNLHAQQPFVRVLLIAQTTSLIYNIHSIKWHMDSFVQKRGVEFVDF